MRKTCKLTSHTRNGYPLLTLDIEGISYSVPLLNQVSIFNAVEAFLIRIREAHNVVSIDSGLVTYNGA